MSQEPEKTTAVEPEQDIVQALDDKGKSEEVLEAPAAPEYEEPKEEEASEDVPAPKSCGSCCETCPNKPKRVLYKEHLVELIGRRISGFGTIPATLFLFVLLVIYSTTTITRFGNVPTAPLLAATIFGAILFTAIAVIIVNVIRALFRVDGIKDVINEFFIPRLWITPIIAIASVISGVFALVIATGDVTVAAKIESLLKEFYSPLLWSGVTLYVVGSITALVGRRISNKRYQQAVRESIEQARQEARQ
jgi:hypothetical protein